MKWMLLNSQFYHVGKHFYKIQANLRISEQTYLTQNSLSFLKINMIRGFLCIIILWYDIVIIDFSMLPKYVHMYWYWKLPFQVRMEPFLVRNSWLTHEMHSLESATHWAMKPIIKYKYLFFLSESRVEIPSATYENQNKREIDA